MLTILTGGRGGEVMGSYFVKPIYKCQSLNLIFIYFSLGQSVHVHAHEIF